MEFTVKDFFSVYLFRKFEVMLELGDSQAVLVGDEAHKKARATREKNLEARAAMYWEQAAAMRAARLALQRVTEREDAAAA